MGTEKGKKRERKKKWEQSLTLIRSDSVGLGYSECIRLESVKEDHHPFTIILLLQLRKQAQKVQSRVPQSVSEAGFDWAYTQEKKFSAFIFFSLLHVDHDSLKPKTRIMST